MESITAPILRFVRGLSHLHLGGTMGDPFKTIIDKGKRNIFFVINGIKLYTVVFNYFFCEKARKKVVLRESG